MGDSLVNLSAAGQEKPKLLWAIQQSGFRSIVVR